MTSELIMKSDVLDILFEKRNKAYGAYTLRKFYNNRLIQSLGIMMSAVIIFSAFTFLPGKPADTGGFIVRDPGFSKIPPAPKVAEVKPKLKKLSTIQPVSSVKLLNTFLFVDNKDSADMLKDLNDMAIGSNTNILLNTSGMQQFIPPTGGNGGIIEPVTPAEPPLDIAVPLDNPEIMPEYPGGMEALRKFLGRNLRTPADLEEGQTIGVKIKFVVGYDGKLQRFELVEDGGSKFNEEVIRVLKKMPAWIPGKTKGQNVSVFYTIPVKFIQEVNFP